ncbi:peptidoglycan DD-metalloendopeptidase family protein [Neobacillus sp. PS3-34]|uniref:peptidoglycan DD-metalloendopeptidase family protein n=1 Tax=Neobacillus sp. PS3-34 TaxID=3070678 RepID=UPI0027E0B060|nr:peptidoglycan DD-metalloendopeptidase family protein [Neobacillus sp. PS3-34]WML47665.1 peptidoglycan DD-metalloendopeptidase family protein [Neobacillus sp. PS3-34]
MRDYIVRFLIAGIMALLVSLLFITGSHSQASMLEVQADNLHWRWPADGVITDKFGTRQGKHKGIDIAGEVNEEVFSVDDGFVEKSYFSSSYGNVVFIKHGNTYVTVYAHLNKRLVEEGQRVKRGDLIGRMGSTGQSTGVHLHFEVHQTEWTFDKKYAMNPEEVLGTAHLGEVVQAGTVNSGANAMEAVSRLEEKDKEMEQAMPVVDHSQEKTQYVVVNGDTLWSIAEKNNLAVEELKNLNDLQTDLIFPSQVLVLGSKK